MTIDWLGIVGGVAALVAVFGYVYTRVYESRAKVREQRVRLELQARGELPYSRDPDERAFRDMRNELSRQQKLLEQLAARDVVVNVTMDSADAQPRHLQHDVAAPDLSPVESVVREISHSLNTPLSQIEIALSLLASSNELRGEDRRSIERAISSVAVCKAFIQAFRYVVLSDSEDFQRGNGGNLGDLVLRACAVICGNKDVKLDVNMPTTLQGYEPTFIMAMILPLIENAVDASPEGSLIRIWSDREKGAHLLYVANPQTGGLPDGIYEPMFSTKSGHDGMGLAVVQRLISSVPGAKLAHKYDGTEIQFSIRLPEEAT
jgi:signal transduction histidine kinase